MATSCVILKFVLSWNFVSTNQARSPNRPAINASSSQAVPFTKQTDPSQTVPWIVSSQSASLQTVTSKPVVSHTINLKSATSLPASSPNSPSMSLEIEFKVKPVESVDIRFWAWFLHWCFFSFLLCLPIRRTSSFLTDCPPNPSSNCAPFCNLLFLKRNYSNELVF